MDSPQINWQQIWDYCNDLYTLSTVCLLVVAWINFQARIVITKLEDPKLLLLKSAIRHNPHSPITHFPLRILTYIHFIVTLSFNVHLFHTSTFSRGSCTKILCILHCNILRNRLAQCNLLILKHLKIIRRIVQFKRGLRNRILRWTQAENDTQRCNKHIFDEIVFTDVT